ncbi:MAG: ureidoglycolate lyase [Thermoanaerobaculia bacterium]
MSAARPGLVIEPLTRAAFAPYGEVVDTSGMVPQAINGGTAARYSPLAQVEVVGDDAGRGAVLGIYRAQPRRLPLPLLELERHPLGSQAFVPLQPGRYLVVVSGNAAEPTPSDVRVFLAVGQQGVSLRAGVWHHALLALDRESDFLVVERASAAANLELRAISAWELSIDG